MKIYEGERRREKRDTGEIKRKTEVRREKRKAEEIKEIQMSEEKVERTTVVMREENKRKEKRQDKRTQRSDRGRAVRAER
jgi:hypothetical protein